ncbi:MAG: hypothetical protein HY692_02895 [Cyanobacteria bacterium NC_groundwater_1444_Ag_S-0.65um_54_12]|nr:hypothetical protein [Cyanobacteria bacterium NC_groundwater_1444_Ag_S-0.65um_54_12]
MATAGSPTRAEGEGKGKSVTLTASSPEMSPVVGFPDSLPGGLAGSAGWGEASELWLARLPTGTGSVRLVTKGLVGFGQPFKSSTKRNDKRNGLGDRFIE